MGFFRKAFTLVELLIVIALFTILGSIVFYVIIKSLKSTATGGGELKAETSIELNTDVLDFDIRHVGYGISKDETSLVLSYCNGSSSPTNPACQLAMNNIHPIYGKLLLLKETSNVVRSPSTYPTVGFVLWNGSSIVYAEPANAKNPTNQCIWLNGNKSLIGQASCNNATSPEMVIGFPLDKKASCKGSNPICCQVQNCTGIAYFLNNSTYGSAKPQTCIDGTYIFYRRTPPLNRSGSIYTIPVINCVSDWEVWFGLDTNGDGQIDKWVNEIPNTDIANNTDLANKLKIVKVYLFVQASYEPDKNFDYCKLVNPNCDSGGCSLGYVKVDTLKDSSEEHSVCLKHPSDSNWKHYRWKTVELIYTSFPNLATFKNP